MASVTRATRALLFGVSTILPVACNQGLKTGPEEIGLLLPCQIRIQPFTKIKSFDEDQIPDGIALVLRPIDRFGDPVKAVGHMYFELYAFQEATAQRKGQRIEFWDRTLATEQDVKLYWDRTAQMYEFPLAWQGQPPPPNRKYILTATYRTPWDETLTDEYILDFTLSRPEILGATAR